MSPYNLLGSHTARTRSTKAQVGQSDSRGLKDCRVSTTAQDNKGEHKGLKGYKVFVVNKDLSQITQSIEVD